MLANTPVNVVYGQYSSVCGCNNNSNNNDHYDHKTVFMASHLVHLINVEQRQTAADPYTEPTNSGLCVCLHVAVN